MEKSHLVHEGHTLKYLIHNIANVRFWEMLVATFHQFVQIAVHELEHEKQLIVLTDNFAEFNYVRVIELL